MIFKYEFPIENYTCDGIFRKQIFIKSDKCPTKEKFMKIFSARLEEEIKLYEEDPEAFMGSNLELSAVNEIINLMKSFPYLSNNYISTGVAIVHPKYGRQVVSVSKLEVWK